MSLTKVIKPTLTLSNDEKNPLRANVTLRATKDANGWDWTVEKINWLALEIADGKVSVDITHQVLSNRLATVLLTSQLADLEEQIYEALAEETEFANDLYEREEA